MCGDRGRAGAGAVCWVLVLPAPLLTAASLVHLQRGRPPTGWSSGRVEALRSGFPRKRNKVKFSRLLIHSVEQKLLHF